MDKQLFILYKIVKLKNQNGLKRNKLNLLNELSLILAIFRIYRIYFFIIIFWNIYICSFVFLLRGFLINNR